MRRIAPYVRSWVNKDRLVIRNEVMMVLMKELLKAKVEVFQTVYDATKDNSLLKSIMVGWS